DAPPMTGQEQSSKQAIRLGSGYARHSGAQAVESPPHPRARDRVPRQDHRALGGPAPGARRPRQDTRSRADRVPHPGVEGAAALAPARVGSATPNEGSGMSLRLPAALAVGSATLIILAVYAHVFLAVAVIVAWAAGIATLRAWGNP